MRSRLVISIGRAGRFETLASARLLPSGSRVPRWLPLEVALSPYAGQRVTLRLEVIPEVALERGAVAWLGSPRIALRPDEE